MNRPCIVKPFLLLALLMAGGCQEEYTARLDLVDRVVVVDGLITDQPGQHRVRLSHAARFQQPESAHAVSGAAVSISVSDGRTVTLQEHDAGTYLTPEGFFARTGLTYTLHIRTPNGMVLRSAPQRMPNPVAVDSVFGQLGSAVFYNRSKVSNRIFATEVEGAYAFVSTSSEKDDGARYRFVSILYVQHGIPISDVVADNCWIKMPVNDFLGTDIGRLVNRQGFSQKMGFVPFFPSDLRYLGLADTLKFDLVRVFINKIYTLNDDSYAFHQAKNRQINNDGRFFEPIAAQPPGNMRCVTDPDQLVLGLFEASPEITLTYRLRMNFMPPRTMQVEMLNSMDHVPDEGCVRNSFPDFWIN